MPPPALPYDKGRWSHLFWVYDARALGRFGVTGIRYFSTPDDSTPLLWFFSFIGGIRCQRDGEDAWLCEI